MFPSLLSSQFGRQYLTRKITLSKEIRNDHHRCTIKPVETTVHEWFLLEKGAAHIGKITTGLESLGMGTHGGRGFRVLG